MRPLLVASAFAFLAAAAPSGAPPIALHPGDAITDRQLFAYLAYPVSVGDWVRYRVVFADRTTVEKTIGFGSENVTGHRTLYIETHVNAQAVTGLPAGSTVGIGTDAVLKTYIAGDGFGDLAHSYAVLTTALKVGDFEYEIAPGAGESYSALSGAVYYAPRSGVVRSVQPVDMRVGGQSLHATHIIASFEAAPLPVGGISNAFTFEVWQSPEAPLGTVAIQSQGDRVVNWRLVAFGHGGYKSLFRKNLDQIRRASQPSMP